MKEKYAVSISPPYREHCKEDFCRFGNEAYADNYSEVWVLNLKTEDILYLKLKYNSNISVVKLFSKTLP